MEKRGGEYASKTKKHKLSVEQVSQLIREELMKKLVLVAIMIRLLSMTAVAEERKTNGPSALPSYEVGLGDVLIISVWKDESLTKRSIVLPDGTISFPLIGEIMAAGKTVETLQSEIGDKISKYVPDPRLSVEVQQVNSMLIYVIGRVNKPGQFLLNGNINVMQALAVAGGLTPFADEDDIRVFRETNGQMNVMEFNYKEVAAGKNLQQNIRIERGDTIVVP